MCRFAVEIGDDSYIGENCFIQGCTIGQAVVIESNCTIVCAVSYCAHGIHPNLRMCFAGARVQIEGQSNRFGRQQAAATFICWAGSHRGW